MLWLDHDRAEPIVLSVPGDRCRALLLGRCSATCSTYMLRLSSAAAPPAARLPTSWCVGKLAPDCATGSPTPPGIPSSCSAHRRTARFRLSVYRPDPDFSTADDLDDVKKVAGRLQSAAAFRLPEDAKTVDFKPRPSLGMSHRLSEDRQVDTREDELLSTYLDFALLNSHPLSRYRKGDHRAQLDDHRRRTGQDLQLRQGLVPPCSKTLEIGLGMKRRPAARSDEGVANVGEARQRLADQLAARRQRPLQW